MHVPRSLQGGWLSCWRPGIPHAGVCSAEAPCAPRAAPFSISLPPPTLRVLHGDRLC